MKLAVIPARGGSKRIPRKNIRNFCGKPMITWSIQAALDSGCFDQVVVSTDDKEISEIAKESGASVPFIRPPGLSDDHTGTIPVVRHTIEELMTGGEIYEHVCCIYPTAPFISAKDLVMGLEELVRAECKYCFAVTSYAFPIQRAIRITGQGRVEMFYPQHFSTRSQDLEEAWHDAGQFYWGLTDAWLHESPMFGSDSVPLPLPRHRVQDIDTFEDWLRAEWLFQALRSEG